MREDPPLASSVDLNQGSALRFTPRAVAFLLPEAHEFNFFS